MGLGKFIAGSIHHVRAQTSILAAHLSWPDATNSRLRLLCEDEPESGSPAVLPGPDKAPARLRHIQAVCSVGRDAPLWFSLGLCLSLAASIKSTGTAFPSDMVSSLPHSSISMVSPFSPVGPQLWILWPLLLRAPTEVVPCGR